jgi:REP element-mobilizing transposase RayT
MRSRYRFTDAQAIHFLTCTTVEWLPVFTRPYFCDLILESLSFCRREKALRLYAYVMMDNHVHLVAEAPDLPRVIQAFKGFTAREILRTAQARQREWLLNQFAYYKKAFRERSKYQVWQEGSHPQLIPDDDVLRQKIDYVHANPVRAGWVDVPEHWRYSSARNYLGMANCAIEIDAWPGFSE